jgi:hypothetical protein
MNCPKCGSHQKDKDTECTVCGIIFHKYFQHIKKKIDLEQYVESKKDNSNSFRTQAANLLFCTIPGISLSHFLVRVLFFLIMIIWGIKFIVTPLETNYTFSSFWHLINLPFHEFGHIFFRPFGRFFTSLGGSLFQLLMPCICLCVFLIKTRDAFAASFCLWWTGESFMDLAPYINDAQSLTLPLVGGNTGRTSPYGFHDWEYILKESGFILHDHIIANCSYKIGSLLILSALIWGGYILYRQYDLDI